MKEIKYEKESGILKVLGHPARLRILEVINELNDTECKVGTIKKRLKMPQSTVSQHIQILKNKRIIVGNKKGVEICYRVENKFVKRLIALLRY